VRENLQVLGVRGNAIEPAEFLRRIEAGFSFSADASDADFSPLHVEPLLDQAADLFDRGIKDRAIHDDLAAKALELSLELNEYVALDRIHREEEASGLYDVDYKLSIANVNAESGSLASYNRARYWASAGIDQHVATFNEVYNAHRELAFTNGLVAYTFQDQRFSGYEHYNVFGNSWTVSEIALDATEKLANNSLQSTSYSLRIQLEMIDASRRGADQRLPGLQARADWDARNATFRRRRTIVARERQDIRSYAATVGDGILNFAKRTPSLRERFHADFRNALARIKVASTGLRQVYGYGAPLPADEGSLDYYDDCLLWTRQAIHWLIRFSRQEQSAIVPISLREIIGDQAWRQQRRLGRFSFDVSADLFPNLAHVRLRGLSGFVLSDDDDDTNVEQQRPKLWRLRAKLPVVGRIIHLDGTEEQIDQSRVPPCLFYRAMRRSYIRDPDVFGASALHNASPIGQWSAVVDGSVPRSRNYDDIRDIELDLFVGFRALSAG
jgi:hypothetical protein